MDWTISSSAKQRKGKERGEGRVGWHREKNSGEKKEESRRVVEVVGLCPKHCNVKCSSRYIKLLKLTRLTTLVMLLLTP
jgi:hypothetical protein